MSSTNIDQARVIDTGDSKTVWTVAFHPDGKHLLSGTEDGVQRWRLGDGQKVGRETGMHMYAVSVSRNHQWAVCGTYQKGASVWDGEMHEKLIDVEDTNNVWTVDVSPDSTRFATGTGGNDNKANIWSITSGQRLVGPLQHDDHVSGVQFSPTGEQIATACLRKSIQIFNSRTGDKLLTVNIDIPIWAGTPLAWSSDGQQIFATSSDNKIQSFDVSTGSQLLQSQILCDGNNDVYSIALAANNKFIAAFAKHSISFLDTSTLTQIGSVIKDSGQIRSIAISADSSYLVTGQEGGKIAIRHLSKFLPDSYFPFHVPTSEEVQRDEQLSTLSGRENERQEHPGQSSTPVESGGHSEDANRDLLEHEAPSSTPALQSFDYGESLSSAPSSHSREDEAPPVGPPHNISQLDALPVPSTSETRPDANLDAVESPEGHSIFKRWRRRVGNKAPASYKPDRRSGKSRKPADQRSPSPALVRVEGMQEGPSRMAAASNKIIKLPTSRNKSRRKTTTPKHRHQHPNKDDSCSATHGAVDTTEADPMQQATNPFEPSAGRVHVVRGSRDTFIAFRVPTWMMCFGSGTEDGTHGAR